MRRGNSPKTETPIRRWVDTAILSETIVTLAYELGEVARMEIEIKTVLPHGAPQQRCPCWHHEPVRPHESLSERPAAGAR